MTESIKKFANIETLSANILLIVTLLALLFSNSPFQSFYFGLFKSESPFNLQLLINDGLMPMFFLLVGLEIKYELSEGNLNSFNKAMLPFIGAIGGMLLPGLIYVIFNIHSAETLRGWAIPTATDIAFALGILSLLGNKTPSALKSFLLTLAVLDDLFAIVIIALFYTSHLSLTFLLFAFACFLGLIALKHFNCKYLIFYFTLGLLLWFCFFKAGIHPTLAGVLLAWTLPSANTLKHKIHPWIAFGILPLFAFANAGTPILTLSLDNIDLNVFSGIFFGLLLGKPLGIFCTCWLSTKAGLTQLPSSINWRKLFSVALLCGIGFTISLFIGDLAFANPGSAHLDTVKAAVLMGSLFSGLFGYLLLRYL